MPIDPRAALAHACRNAGGQAAWARQHGISRAYVSQVLAATRPPSQRILDALGLVRDTSYRPADPPDSNPHAQP